MYFLAWSASFYPQVLLNRRRRSVEGLSLDMLYLNLWGFLCYTVYNVAFYASDAIRREYRDRFGDDNQVQLNDVLFGVHAMVLASFTIGQTFVYRRAPGQTVAVATKAFIGMTSTIAILLLLLSLAGLVLLLDVLYYLSFVKMAITLMKYTPQVGVGNLIICHRFLMHFPCEGNT
ncbi:hypothetical protein HK405_010961 [Cladochytrium tenue]|nr:hypothetical protein HK405_010961 [Cladochytrium tenue]